jgi:hypothetical protein
MRVKDVKFSERVNDHVLKILTAFSHTNIFIFLFGLLALKNPMKIRV